MKHLRHLAVSVLLVLSLTATALAAEVPVSLVVENLNGQQRIVKTYELPPGTDPETLKEPSFEYDGFTHTWAYTTKDEHTFLETKAVTETVKVETGKKDLNTVLEQLAPSILYDDGEFTGELALDHTTITTEAAGYTTKSGKVTATKTIGPLDRNDMSYIPATTVKDGRTLTLANVEWQVIGTDLVGDVLAPSSYQAVATYSASTSSQVATGYVSTAEYKGTVTASGIESITYTVVYVGTEIVPEPPQPTEPVKQGGPLSGGNAAAIGRTLLVIALLAALALTVPAFASDYSFTTDAPQDFCGSTSYEDVYGSQYNYGGKNVVDYQVPELEYGVQSTTMTGVMERTILPGLQQTVGTGGGGYGVAGGGGPITVLVEGTGAGGSTSVTNPTVPTLPTTPTYQQPAYTSVEGMAYKDGHIGTVKIPSLNINMKVWEGETAESMKKGLGHYSSTSAWNGNVAACGHNRGAKYVIGAIKDLEQGDTITYTTVYGTRTYAVETVTVISNTDWSYLQSTADNRITLTTCLADHPESRVVVQAVEKK